MPDSSIPDPNDLVAGKSSPPDVLPLTPSGPSRPRQLPVIRRRFGDTTAIRGLIYKNVLDQANNLKPIENKRFRLSLHDVHYADPDEFPIAKQKEAILGNKTLYRRLKGTWRLSDVVTGKPVDEKKMTIAQVPHMTERGTFILNGTETTLAHQLRLLPGIFTRVKSNQEVEAHVNAMPGKGVSHRYFFEPETGVFRINIGQSKVPLMPVLKSLGVTDKQMRDHWGDEITAINQQHDSPHVIDKLYQRLVRHADLNAAPENKRKALAEAITKMELDPEVTKRTLGHPFSNLSADAILATTRKLLLVNKGQADTDDRDHLAFQTLLGPEDVIAERIGKDRTTISKLLWNASRTGTLDNVQPGALSGAIKAVFNKSGLAQAAEEVNAAELVNHQSRITRLGEGGIGNVQEIPEESKAVHPSQMGFIDAVLTPESFRAGVDLRTAFNVQKGTDGRIYTRFTDVRTGKPVYRSPQEAADLTIAFPNEMGSGRPFVAAMAKGRLKYVPRNQVDIQLDHMEHAFSPLSNMIPMKSTVKGQRVSMGGRMLAQALPLQNAEAPHVQSGVPGFPFSFEALYGRHMGIAHTVAQKPGRVVSVSPTEIKVRYDDGELKKIELYHNFPFNRKTLTTNTPLVKAGDRFGENQLLAKSNYTTDDGTAALGVNARVAYLPFRGLDYEDAAVISESMAKRMTSEHMYQHAADFGPETHRGKRAFISLFPSAYPKKILDTLDEHGVVKPGTVVDFDHPLVLSAKEKDRAHNQIHRSAKSAFTPSTITWNHHVPGIVTDVVHGRNSAAVVVKAYMPMQQGDKLCYDPETEVLTDEGWKPVAEVTLQDKVATLVDGECFEYIKPVATHRYQHSGRMYRLKTTQVDLLVTDNHKLYAHPRYDPDYGLHEARDLFGKRYRLLRNGTWTGKSPEFVELPGVTVAAGQSGRGTRDIPALRIKASTYAMLLGMFLSEGHLINQPPSGSYGLALTQIKPHTRQEMLEALKQAGIKYTETKDGVVIYSLVWMLHLQQFGHAKDKFIPKEVFSWGKDLQSVLYRWLMWGDGHYGKTTHVYTTTSKRLADDVQRLALHLGVSANIKETAERDGVIKGHPCRFSTRYDVYMYRNKNRPTVNHGHAKKQGGQLEEWVNYSGPVHCVTTPVGHVIYVRRNGKPVWSGNSGRYGDKSVVSEIIPDDQMPHGEDGKPYEILVSPLGMISRINSAQAIESALGKVAAKTGKPYKVQDFDPNKPNLTQYALDELKKHGLSDTETVIDPSNGRRIPNILTGNRFFMKLMHTSEGKGQGRGASGGYDVEGTPSKGGETGSKRISLMDTNALLSHGATGVLRDGHVIRGQLNEDYWLRFEAGHTPPDPKVPKSYERFIHELKAAGINVVREGNKSQIMALTDKDINHLAGDREILRADTVDWKAGLKPIKGGLFDPGLTGGHGGNQWARITLTEPMPSPVMEDPIRRILGITEAKFLDVLSGKDTLHNKSGPEAIKSALEAINIPKEIEKANQEIKSGRKSFRDAAIRKLKYLTSAQELGIHPKDWMLHSVPVLPPAFRPVSLMANRKGQVVSDPNFLYKEVFDSNKALKDLKGEIDDVSQERLNLYNSFKAVTGLGDPIQPKHQEKDVKGVLRHLFGSAPKFSTVQFKLLGASVNLVGRGVIVPNPDLDMDQIGIPEHRAWDVYRPFIVRGLIRNGMPRMVALEAVRDRKPAAREQMLKVMNERPVLVNRYPVLHKYGLMAMWPRPVKGDAVHINPLVTKAYGADFDGNCITMSTQVEIDVDINTLMKYGTIVGTEFYSSLENLVMRLTNKTIVEWVNAGGRRLRLPIGEFPRVGAPVITSKGQEVYDVPEGISVISYDHQTAKACLAPVAKFTYEKNHPCVKVTTRRKRSVEVSDNESLCVFDVETGEIMKEAPANSKGKLVPYVRAEPITGKAYDRETGHWYGNAIADGWTGERVLGYAKNDKDKRDYFVTTARKLFGDLKFNEYTNNAAQGKNKYGNSVKLHIYGPIVSQVKPLCHPDVANKPDDERGALYKHIPPDLLLNGSRECLLGLLAGLLEGDASIGWNTVTGRKRFFARFCTSSPYLVESLDVLLRKLGVRNGVTITPARGHSKQSYTVSPSVNDLHRIFHELVFVGKHEKQMQAEFVASKPGHDILDIVPITKDLAKKLSKSWLEIDRLTDYGTYLDASRKGYVTRDAAKKAVQFFTTAPGSECKHKDWARFVTMAENDEIHWDIVKTVESIKVSDVCDFVVPSTKVYAVGNGLVIWDTMQYHVPVDEEAVQDAIHKMLPSKNLFSAATFKALYVPNQEYVQGLHAASTQKDTGRPRVFGTRKEALAAYRRGDISLGAPVEIIEDRR